MAERQLYLFGSARDHEVRIHREEPAEPDVQTEGPRREMQRLLFAETEQTVPQTEEVNTEAEELLTGREGVAQFMERMDGMSAYDLAREFTRLKLQHENTLFPELSILMRQRRDGFVILLNLVRLGKIKTDASRQAIAATAYPNALGMTELQLSQVIEQLGIRLQGRRYRKMNGLITAFHNASGAFNAFMRDAKGYWKEVLPLIVSGQASSYADARSQHAQKASARLRPCMNQESA